MRAVRCMCRNAQVAIFRSCGLALEAFALALEHTQQAADSSHMVIIEHRLYSESLGSLGAGGSSSGGKDTSHEACSPFGRRPAVPLGSLGPSRRQPRGVSMDHPLLLHLTLVDDKFGNFM